MFMKKNLLFILVLVLFCQSAFSQDKIYRKNGKVVEAKIVEVGVDEIKYREFSNPDGPIYVLESDRISKIVYANGKTEKFVMNIKDPEKYEGQLSKAIKLDFLGPLIGYSQFSFEKSTGVGKGYEISLGIIGLGKTWTIQYYDNTFREMKKKQAGGFCKCRIQVWQTA